MKSAGGVPVTASRATEVKSRASLWPKPWNNACSNACCPWSSTSQEKQHAKMDVLGGHDRTLISFFQPPNRECANGSTETGIGRAVFHHPPNGFRHDRAGLRRQDYLQP